MSLAAGIGSMPGEDYTESLRVVAGLTPDLLAITELPARGVHAGMTGRAVAVLVELGADLQPAGWRLTGGGSGVDQRRARSLLAQDLDTVEQQWGEHTGILKTQVAGPWTLAATIERPRGDRLIADHGARRDLGQSLVEGVREHLADIARRVPRATLVLQIDEPALLAVLEAGIPTASGWGRHRAVHAPEVDAMLRRLTSVAHEAGARAVLHCCAADVPVSLVAGAGFDAVSFDIAAAGDPEPWAAAFEGGLDLWTGVVSTDAADVSDSTLIGVVDGFFHRLGFDVDAFAGRTVVTPTCGLAGASPSTARAALETCARVARR